MADENKSFLETNRDVLAAAGLVVIVLAVFLQAYRFDFINFDDGFYVYENPTVLSGLNWESIKWALTTFHAGNWHPLTWLSLELDVQLYGAVPGVHHAVNVLIHAVSSVLAFYVFERMTGRYWESVFVAALFAVHPAHVESVAWIAERKDVLCALFWLLTMWFYVGWTRSGEKAWSGKYIAALAMFALALMAKPMAVTLPFVLILCDIWPLARSRDLVRLVTEKLPFFALAAASAVVTVIAQRSAEAVQSLEQFPLGVRVENAAVSYAKYIAMAVWPSKLAVWYPYKSEIEPWQIAASALIFVAVTAISIWQVRERKYILVGWLWFVGTLVPVIGLVQVGLQAYADRYTYIPYFGLFIIAVFGAAELCGKLRLDRRILAAVGAVIVSIFAVFSFWQTQYWEGNETLYKRTLAVTDGNYVIAQNLCAHLINVGRMDEAGSFCESSLAAKPDYSPAVSGLGVIKYNRRDLAGAEAEFQKALDLSPTAIGNYKNLAMAQFQQGKGSEAEATLRKAITLKETSETADVYDLLGTILVLSERQAEAADAFEHALKINPDLTSAREKLKKARPAKQ